MRKLLLCFGLLGIFGSPVYSEPAGRPKIKTLFDYKQELGLSDEQIANMKTFLTELNGSVKASRAQISKLETEYRALISSDSTTTGQARAKLTEIADATVVMRLKDLEISRKITNAMTPEQRGKWKSIQVQVRTEQSKGK
ncbi:MAG: periplasmic heavy metal sensor [Candidatus Eremiobacteraeota bacterium]|nr:periplasmic heavy metal sensor [Candidatus Eremiobacteraeota bacterium]